MNFWRETSLIDKGSQKSQWFLLFVGREAFLIHRRSACNPAMFKKNWFFVNSFVGALTFSNNFFFLQIFIAILLLVVTMINSVLIREAIPENQSKNNSFHRIYSNCDEDLSENSDDETTRFSDSYSSTTGARKFDTSSMLNKSFISAKSFGSSALKPATAWMSSVNNLNHSFRGEFQRSPCYQQSSPDLFQKHSDRQYFFPNDTISETQRCSSMIGLNTSFRIPDDCQNKLTDLNISGLRHRSRDTITCSSPTPSIISLNRHRSQLLTPARLNFNGKSSLIAPVATSWVAGGFFGKNNISPQKRQQPQVLLHPILSRTSSQSSGFESQASSAHNGNANGSRESSIAGDVFSNFSEPTLIADSASQMGIDAFTNSMFATARPKPQPFFPVLNQSTFIESASCKPESFTNHSTYNWTNANNTMTSTPPQPVYHQFGTHRDSLYNNDSAFSYHSPTIRKGNLMKPLNDSYFFDDK